MASSTDTRLESEDEAQAQNDANMADSFELVAEPLPTLSARERSIPIRTSDLVGMMLAEPGLSDPERAQLGQLVKLLSAVFHYEFLDRQNELKGLYAPIDPDNDCLVLKGQEHAVAEKCATAFLGPFEEALVRANYVPLDLPVLERAISSPNELGLDYIPDLGMFTHLKVYVRGEGKVLRVVRSPSKFFRKRTVTYDAYRRVVLALKYRPGRELDEYVRSDVLYLRMFKDVPFVEMDMHMPEQGTKIKMRLIDKLQIATPVVTGLPALAAKLFLEASISPLLLAFVLVAPISAGVRSFLGYRTARTKYFHHMIRHLYYLTLANNASVINRMIDSGEEEELKEALLGYYFLWRARQSGCSCDQRGLDQQVETFLSIRTGYDVDFEVGDALAKLERLGLVERDGPDKLLALPIEQALAVLDQQWDNYFRFANPAGAANER